MFPNNVCCSSHVGNTHRPFPSLPLLVENKNRHPFFIFTNPALLRKMSRFCPSKDVTNIKKARRKTKKKKKKWEKNYETRVDLLAN